MPEGEHSHHHGGCGPALAAEAAEHEASAWVLGKGSPQGLEQPVEILGVEGTKVRVSVLGGQHSSQCGPPLQRATPTSVLGVLTQGQAPGRTHILCSHSTQCRSQDHVSVNSQSPMDSYNP